MNLLTTTTTTTTPPSPHKAKNPIPPPWYNLHTTNNNDPYIALPTSPSRPPIFLTPFYPSDAPALQATISIPSINASLISVPYPYTLSCAHSWLNLQCNPSSHSSSSSSSPPPDTSPSSQPWLQALRTTHPGESGTFIGAVSLTPADSASYALSGLLRREEGEGGESESNEDDDDGKRGSYILGYYLHPTHHNCGIMRDAVRALLAWGVAERGVRRVRADIVVENRASRAVVEGIEGFEKVGGGGEVEVQWPEGKGGGVRRVGSWVWKGGRGVEM